MASVRSLPPSVRGRGVTAVLGPTNTGKTHLAIERMVAQPSGLIGLPLRLLAREVYARVVARAGVENVALITGEERIKPPSPRYWVSTVEAMPLDLDVDFVAIDEIQIAADLDRGHVFTDRLLNRRGRHETLLLGAATMRPLVEKLLPGAAIIGRPRLSTLSYAGEKKITRLPRRSAIVAFSAEEVYAIAELIRRQRGGAAVVMGALSPRTRNAQVDLYQNGDVDYIVATDAIGMGLNLDVDHIAFASDRKFDGFQFRRLNAGEFGQIAGRAGRHLRDGTFGTTGRCAPFEAELAQQLESHAFEPVKLLQWRNPDPDMASLSALQASLAVAPLEAGLTRAPSGEDIAALAYAAQDPAISALVSGPASVARLWEVCQVPDYRKLSTAAHGELIATLYSYLMRDGKIPDDWFAAQVRERERLDGDIDTLSARIAHIRTWSFVANRPDWLRDPVHWQNITREVEDRLSDALHEQLTLRFVDRRTSVLMRRLREKDMLEAEITSGGEVLVEGQHVGHLAGFRFTPDTAAEGSDGKAVRAVAQKALAGEFEARAERLAAAKDTDLVLAIDGTLRWLGEPIGRLIAGDKLLAPRIRLLADDALSGAAKERAETRLALWLDAHVQRLLGPLLALEAAEDVAGIARGVAFQLVEGLGIIERGKVAEEIKALDQGARAVLRRQGVRFGAYHVYLPSLLKPAPRTLAAQLWALQNGGLDVKGLDEIPALSASGRTSFKADPDIAKALYRMVGYRVCGERAIRVDILERLADLIRPAIAFRPGITPGEPPAGAADGNGFTATVAMTSLAGCAGEDFASILRSLGYRMERRPVAVTMPLPPQAESSVAMAPNDVVGGDPEETVDPASTGVDTEPALAAVGEEGAAEAGQTEIEVEPSSVPSVLSGDEADSAQASEAKAESAAQNPPDAANTAPVNEPPVDSGNDVVLDDGVPAAESADGTPPVQDAPVAGVESPVLVEVWRPGGRGGEHHRPRREEGGRRDRPEGQRRGGPRHQRRPEGASERASAAATTAGNTETPPDGGAGVGERPGQRAQTQKGRNGGRPHRNNDGRRDGARAPEQRPEQRAEQRRAPDRRDRAPDPNSPFAALAELKARLEADSKTRR